MGHGMPGDSTTDRRNETRTKVKKWRNKNEDLVATKGAVLTISLLAFQITHGDERGLLGHHPIVSGIELVSSIRSILRQRQLETLACMHLASSTVHHPSSESRWHKRRVHLSRGGHNSLCQKLVKLRRQAHGIFILLGLGSEIVLQGRCVLAAPLLLILAVDNRRRLGS